MVINLELKDNYKKNVKRIGEDMKKLELKVNKDGICKEFNIDGIPFGKNIAKLEIIIEPSSKAKLIMTYSGELDIKTDDVEIIKNQIKK